MMTTQEKISSRKIIIKYFLKGLEIFLKQYSNFSV